MAESAPPPMSPPPMSPPAGPAPPEVPPGPGVEPPFPAAPTEGRSARRWWSAGVAAALLVMCCGVGGLAVGGMVFTLIPALNEQAQRAVGDYLDALIERDWERAWELRCEADQQAEPLPAFTARVSAPPALEAYELGELDLLDNQDSRLRLPAELSYADGTSDEVVFLLGQDPQSGTLVVCERDSGDTG